METGGEARFGGSKFDYEGYEFETTMIGSSEFTEAATPDRWEVTIATPDGHIDLPGDFVTEEDACDAARAKIDDFRSGRDSPANY